jgi:GrpB protein
MSYIREYQKGWIYDFKDIARFYEPCLPDGVRTQNVGSTSVPGMPAKDIFDVDASTAPFANIPAPDRSLITEGGTMAITVRLFVALLLLTAGFSAGLFWSQQWPGSYRETQIPLPELISSPGSEAERQVTVQPNRAAAADQHRSAALRAFARTASIKSEFDQSAALYALAAPMNADGILHLLESAEQVLSGNDLVGATSILIGRYAELDFPAALDYAVAQRRSDQEVWIRSIFHNRSRLDLEDATRRASELSVNLRRIAGLAILRANDHLALDERRTIAKTLGLTDQVLVAAPGSNPEEAWREANNISNPTQRMQAQMQVAIAWSRSDPSAALQASNEIDHLPLRTGMQTQILGSMVGSDSAAALAWVEAQPEGQHRDQLMAIVAQSLAAEDPEQAQNLMERLPKSMRDQVETSLWTQRAVEDPEGAAAWVASRSDGGGGSANHILMVLAMSQLESASADRFLQALPASMRSSAASTYIQIISNSDPEGAAKRVEQMPDSDQRSDAARSLITNWTQRDPQAARRWIERQPDKATPELFRALATGWSLYDSSAALEFANGMDAGLERDQFLAGLVGMAGMGQLNAEDGASLIERISDPELRAQLASTQRQIQETQGAADGVGAGVR